MADRAAQASLATGMANHDHNEHSNDTGPPSPLQSFVHDERTPLVVKPPSSPSLVLSKPERRAGLVQFLALCLVLFMIGWNDGSIGPLLPRIVQVFKVNYETVSWIFILTCAGIMLGGLASVYLNDRLGYGKVIVVGSLLHSLSFIVQSLGHTLPFPAFAASYFLGGLGMAIQGTQCNGYMALVKHHGELKMGFVQASYVALHIRLGALISPIFATSFAQMPTRWSAHYFTSFVLSLSSTLVLVAVFRLRKQDDCLRESGEVVLEPVVSSGNESRDGDSKYSQILRLKAVHLLVLFLILYNGVEFSIAGWVVTFLIDVRGGGPESGYVTAGFFGGLVLGRIALIWVNQQLGEVRAVYFYSALVILAQLLVWITPSAALNALLICVIGVLLGPIYPIVIRHAARILPRTLVMGAIGLILSSSAACSMLLPFITGRMAERMGLGMLMPFLAVIMAFVGAVWWMVPTKPSEEL